MRTTTAPTLALLVSVVLAACKDDSPTVAPPDPTSFELTLPDTAYAGQAFELTVTAVASNGTTPDATFSGDVTLSVSGGSVSPATLVVTAGVGQGSVTLTDLAGTATISASLGSISGSANLLVVGLEPVASVQIVPGSFLFTDASQTRQLTAWAFDANGNPTQATFTWSSSDPGLVDVDAAGLATSGSGLGSAQVFAEADGVQSPPSVAVVAKPVAGAVLIGDDHVVRAATPAAAPGALRSSALAAAGSYDLEPVDPEAEYGLGWQYRVTLTGIEAPSAGQILVGTGDAPIAGRVVSVSTTGTAHVVTLEMVEIDQVFAELVYDEELPLDDAEIVLTDDVVAAYDVTRSREGAIDFIPRAGAAAGPLEFNAGPFKCKTDVGLPLQVRVVPVMRITPSLSSFSEYSTVTGFTRSGVRGTADFHMQVSPKIASRLEGTLECKWTSPIRIIIPLPGPVGLFLGGHVPLGAGFEIKGTATLQEYGASLTASVVAGLDMGVECLGAGANDPCAPFVSSTDGQKDFSWRADEFTLAGQDRIEARLYPFLFATVGLGPSAILTLLASPATFDLVEVRAGLAQDLDLKSASAQIADDGYGSNIKLGFLALVKPGSSIERFLKLFGRTALKLEARVEVPLTELPKGTISVTPGWIRASTPEQPGDKATFTVTLDKSTYLTLEAVEAIHILWTRPNEFGVYVQENSQFPCELLPGQSGQTKYECQTDFPESFIGEHRFHAFLEVDPFGYTENGLYEISKDATAALTVGSGPSVVVSPRTAFFVQGDDGAFTASVYGLTDPGVTWSAAFGTMGETGIYAAPTIPEGAVVVDTIVATSVEDPTVSGKALAVVSHPRILPASAPCVPSATDDCSRAGYTWGDPHVTTPDGMMYDFMASGDYVLSRSTDPEDDFEVQARFIKPSEQETFSWNHGVAMRVMGNVVEIYANRAPLVNGVEKVLVVNNIVRTIDLDGGSLTVLGDTTVVSWPDRTQVRVKPSDRGGVLAEVRVVLPTERRGAVEGLFGTFDGDLTNDIQTATGEPLQPGSERIYTDFRQDWWIPTSSPQSLFSDRFENFDASFPPGAVSISDLSLDDVVRATGVCRDAGVLDATVMEKCILDVVLTGNDQWAVVAAGADPNTLGIIVSPQVAFLAPGDSREFGAVISGTTDRRVTWSATDGVVTPTSDNVMTYTAPTEPGTYTITATSLFDGSLVTTATVEVTGAPSGYSKVWNGSINSDWTRADNWTPVGMPDSTDNVLIPTGMPNEARWLSSSTVVNDVTIEADAAYNGGGAALRVRGNAVMDAGEFVQIKMEGVNKTVRGRMGQLMITGSVRASGPVDLQGATLYLAGGVFDVGGQRVDARDLYAPENLGGRLVMHSPDDHLVVQYVLLERLTSTAGTLTDGTLEVRNGDFTLRQNASFFATEAHRVVFSGDGSQEGSLSIGCGGCWDLVNPPTNWRLNDVEFSNPAGVSVGTHPVRVDGVITVTDGVVRDRGSQLHLFGALLVQGGSFDAGFTVRAPTVVLPSRVGSTVKFGSEGTDGTLVMTLADDFEAGGVWIANGSGVTLGGHTLRVDGTLATRWGASLVMDSDADSLIVAGSIEFGGGNQNVAFGGERFSAGVFELQGNLLDQFHHFRSSGTNKVRFSGTSAQTIRSYCAGLGACEVQDTTYQDVEVVNPAGVTFVDSPVRIMGDLTVLTGAAATFDNVTAVEGALDLPGTLTLNANKTLSVTGALLLRLTGVLNNNGTMTVGSCTQEAGSTVNGTNPCP